MSLVSNGKYLSASKQHFFRCFRHHLGLGMLFIMIDIPNFKWECFFDEVIYISELAYNYNLLLHLRINYYQYRNAIGSFS